MPDDPKRNSPDSQHSHLDGLLDEFNLFNLAEERADNSQLVSVMIWKWNTVKSKLEKCRLTTFLSVSQTSSLPLGGF